MTSKIRIQRINHFDYLTIYKKKKSIFVSISVSVNKLQHTDEEQHKTE